MTSKVVYLGDLRTESTHIQSGNTIISDAPSDNNGKGEAFSPTDYVANALASCILTIMGIKAANMDFDMKGATASVTKHMKSDPRMISKIEVAIEMPYTDNDKSKSILERSAFACPVYLSLHPDIEKVVTFSWKLQV